MAASAMMILASCSKTEVVYQDQDPQEIGFFSIVKKQTKAAISGTEFNHTNMVVAASISDSEAIEDGVYFGRTEFVPEGGYFKGGKYWPIQSATLDFLAVAPEVEDQVVTTFPNGAASATVVVTDNETNQHDVMYAAAEATKVANVAPTAVGMEFNHALAWVFFKFKGDNNVTVNSIAVNARYNGTLTINNGENGLSVNWDDAPTTAQDVANVPGADNNGVELTTAEQSFGNGLLVVPGTGVQFTISYTITDPDGTTSHDYTYVYGDGDGENVEWAAGKKYTYSISMNVNEIRIDPRVTDWSAQNTTGVDIN
ncbi:MAG: fimbrillin family protein [Bacteroidales bacterium]|nr:fimbrillin family protein [Bacteroidales bacterium]